MMKYDVRGKLKDIDLAWILTFRILFTHTTGPALQKYYGSQHFLKLMTQITTRSQIHPTELHFKLKIYPYTRTCLAT